MILDDSDFSKIVEQSSGVAMTDFFATWCGPCKMLAPVIEEISNERSDIKVYKVDVDAAPELCRKYSISAVPTVIFFKDGKKVDQFEGYLPKEDIISRIDSIK